MDGAAPLSYATVEAWSRLGHVDVEPWEVEALLALDAVIRHPNGTEPVEDAEPKPVPVWPTKKAG